MKTTIIGFPNTYRSLIKTVVEGLWTGTKTERDITCAETEVLAYNRHAQRSLDLRPVFDIDIYDRLLKTAVTFGFVPERFGTATEANTDLAVYLSIPRGTTTALASSMVKWFNTNYHIVQPEIEGEPHLVDQPRLPVPQDGEKIALIGPWTLLTYSKNKTSQSEGELFQKLSEQYVTLINYLPSCTIQLEEPSFLTHSIPKGYLEFVEKLRQRVHLHVYFGAVNSFAKELFALPIAGIGLDFVDGPANLNLLPQFPADKDLIAGITNGRNVWPATTKTELTLAEICRYVSSDRLYISPSCSLQHLPLTARGEDHPFLFAEEKIAELEKIKTGTLEYQEPSPKEERLPRARIEPSKTTPWVSAVPFPTTTIGSFPQTKEIRTLRKKWRERTVSQNEYVASLGQAIQTCIATQEELGLDVLVHGEFERADMVEYFAENLVGFVPIKSAVQSYGTRHVRPPVIIGDIRRERAFTVEWIKYAQSLTTKPVKGMLTGPVTLVQWSYPREDISREAQFYQFALALSAEVDDLVDAGIKHIQIDEPALREGLPLDPQQREFYLHHALNAFRLVSAVVPDDIVIHSHLCFSDFADILDAISDMGVDVLSIEDSKYHGKTAASLSQAHYPASIGLGVYDVHSPRLPTLEEMTAIPQLLLDAGMDPHRIWFNPDCGLKTRGPEAHQQLERMMAARNLLLAKLK